MKLEFVKDGQVKLVDEEHKDIQNILLDAGWSCDSITNELDELKDKADELGIKYHPNIGLDRLKQKIEQASKEE